MARKIIQISSCGVDRNEHTQCSIVTTALCNDGSSWQLYDENEGWYQLPSVPQETVESKVTSTNNQSMSASQISHDIVKDLLILQSKLVGHTEVSEIEQVFDGIENVVAKLHTL